MPSATAKRRAARPATGEEYEALRAAAQGLQAFSVRHQLPEVTSYANSVNVLQGAWRAESVVVVHVPSGSGRSLQTLERVLVEEQPFVVVNTSAEARGLYAALMTPLGNSAREDFVFTQVRNFVERDPDVGLALIRSLIDNESAPSTSSYNVAALLGHIRNDAISFECRLLLRAYRRSENVAVREGATDGLDYLES